MMESDSLSLYQHSILLIALLCGCGSADESVRGLIGRDVTLTCRYDSQYYGTLAMCWGRGAIPSSGCGNEVIRSDGAAVTSRASERYLLRGDLTQGDVSLTIRQLRESDGGTYGCRVDIPGWFNDHKHHAILTVQPGPPDPVRLELRERRSRMFLLRWSAGFDGGSPLTGYTLEQKDMTDSWGSAVRSTSFSPQLTRATVDDLQPFSTYNIRLFSKNAVGTSAASNTLIITTKEEAPGGPPLDVQVEALSPSSLEVSWRPPRADLHHGVILRYVVAYRVLENSPATPWTNASVYATGRRQTLVLSGLPAATWYAVGVQAVNGEGKGPASTQQVCSTLEDEHTTSTSSFMADSTSPPVEHVDTSASTSTVSEGVADSTDPWIVWEQTTLHEGQEEVSSRSTGSPQSTSFSNKIQAIISEDEEEKEAESNNRRLVAIVVPVVLVALIVVMTILWQLKRLKGRKANLDISWKNNGSLAFSDTQLIPEL